MDYYSTVKSLRTLADRPVVGAQKVHIGGIEPLTTNKDTLTSALPSVPSHRWFTLLSHHPLILHYPLRLPHITWQ